MCIRDRLADALGDQASNMAELCFMAPGIPWSGQLLDDFLADFRFDSFIDGSSAAALCVAECEARACISLMTRHGIRKRPDREALVAHLHAKRSSDPLPIVHSK
eukprot:10817118-Karenia_brevis.AAC.1